MTGSRWAGIQAPAKPADQFAQTRTAQRPPLILTCDCRPTSEELFIWQLSGYVVIGRNIQGVHQNVALRQHADDVTGATRGALCDRRPFSPPAKPACVLPAMDAHPQ